MSIARAIVTDFNNEAALTRKVLAAVPDDKLAWKPHEKSRSLGELAVHIANIPGLIQNIATADEFAAGSAPPAPVPSAEEIRATFEKNVRLAEDALKNLDDVTAKGDWRLVFRGKEVLKRPRIQALRVNVLNHIYHHRGQLSVYLRLLNVPVPMVYGPTADENPFA